MYTPGLMAAVAVNWRSIGQEETDAAGCDKTRCSGVQYADTGSRRVLFLLLTEFSQKKNSYNDGDVLQP